MRSQAAASREHARRATGQRDLDKRCIDTIRTLAIDAVEKAQSGHAGTPMALAPVAYTLWQRFLRYDPSDLLWPNRDRFVLSAGHASMLLYALLHLAGVRRVERGRVTDDATLSLDDIKNFRQLDSLTPGHSEYGHTTGVETTTGPLGQGCGNSVGMAIASRWLAARYNRPNATLFDFDVYTICSDGDLMEGVASEAASLAGHLQLSNLCWTYDSNTVTIEGHTDLAMSEDVATRFKAYRWNVVRLADANDAEGFARAVEIFRATEDRPTLIIVDSIIGYGAPHKQNTAAAHSDALGTDEVKLAKRFYGWPEDAQFLVPDGVYESFRNGIGRRGRAVRDDWIKTFEGYKKTHAQPACEVERCCKVNCRSNGIANCRTFRPTRKVSPRAKRPARCSMRSPKLCHGSSAAPVISRHRPKPPSPTPNRLRRVSPADASCTLACANTRWAPSSTAWCCRNCAPSARPSSPSATICARRSGLPR